MTNAKRKPTGYIVYEGPSVLDGVIFIGRVTA